MPTRHDLSPALRLLRRLTPSHTSSFHASRHLKEHASDHHHPSPKETPHDHREPTSEARPHLPTKVRHLMRSTPNPLTIIVSSHPPPRLGPSSTTTTATTAPQTEHQDTTDPPPPPPPPPPSHPSASAGLLVSSFNTVTLSPKPYVSFNVRLPSRTWDALRASSKFVASGLRDARVADAFAKRKVSTRDDPSDDDDDEGVLGHLAGGDGRLRDGRGGTWWMRCRLLAKRCVKVQDHMVVVARVTECGEYEGGEGIGLVYAEGEYRKVGEVVDVEEEKKEDIS